MEISYCGLKCNECPIYVATATNNTKLKIKLAKEYSTEDCSFTKEDMLCYGCHSDKIKNSKMCGDCKIRNCSNHVNINTCGECTSYPCKLVEMYVPVGSVGRVILDEMKSRN